MRRLLAAFLAVCCLFALTAAAYAEPEEAPTEQPDDTLTETPEETPEESPEETPEETPQTKPQEPSAADLLLAGSTHISSIDTDCTLKENGTAAYVQKIEVTFASVMTKFRFGVPADAKDAEVQGWRAKTSEQDGVRYLTVENEAGFAGTQTFTLTSTLGGLVTKQNEQQLLQLPLLAPQDYRIAACRFHITMPASFEGQPVFLSDYYGEQLQDTMTVASESSVITGAVNSLVQDHEALSMELSLPEGYFSGRFASGGGGVVLTVITVLLALLTVLYWWRGLRSAPLRVQARTLPPDGVNPGDLPYLLSGGNADFNMLVSHWAALGYLSFYVTADGNVVLLRHMDMGNERRKYERKLFDLLFGGSDRCDGASTRYKKVGEKAMGVIPRYWGRRLYSPKSGSPVLARLLSCLVCALTMVQAMDVMAPDKLHGLLLFVGFVTGFALGWMIHYGWGAWYVSDPVKGGVALGSAVLLLILGGAGNMTLLMLLAVVLTAFIGHQTTHGGLRSAYGDQVVSQTLGYRRFLRNASEHHVQQMLRRDPQYFYKTLPYAHAMGQGRRFVSLFHDVQMEPCPWYEAAEGAPNTTSAFYAHYCETLAMLNVSIRR